MIYTDALQLSTHKLSLKHNLHHQLFISSSTHSIFRITLLIVIVYFLLHD